MHFYALVVVPNGDNPHEAVDTAMAPHIEREDGDDWVGHWDWWVIGGRWTGVLDDYDPAKDPANIERCDLCGGTGDRASFRGEPKEGQHPSGCNGCLGEGTRTKWPTQWVRYSGDVATARAVAEADEPAVPHTLVVDGEWHECESYNHETGNFDEHPDWNAFVLAKLREVPDARVVVVDYHS